ncbi:MAG: hypothetical protein KatS3mg068_0462 [Candidatus Sericytochromatia bacterium]|nr:MAG: hypothetical protein KatS3mg068_0462 [Candidatus Sericytochromatia bacterium]
MKKFFLLIYLILIPSIAIAQVGHDTVKVTFINKVDINFLNKITKLTSTKFKKLNDKEYEFKIDRIVTKDLLDKYSEFFSIIKNVKEVTPLPSIKSYDNISSNIYIRNDLPKYNQENKENKDNEENIIEENKENTDLFSQPLNKEYTIKFKDNINSEDIDNLKLLSGANFEYDDKNKLYKVNIPEETDLDYTLSVINNSDLVSSFEPVKNNLPTSNNNDNNNQNKNEVKNELSNYLNSGIVTNIPINYQKEIKISFETDREEDIKWIIEQSNGKILYKKGFNSFIVRFPDNINPYMVIRAIKVCSGILSVQLSN